MKQFSYKIFLSIVLLCYSCASAVIAQNGVQYWNEVELNYNLNSKVMLKFGTEQQWFDDLSYFGMYNFTPGINYSFSEHFNITLNYKYERENSKEFVYDGKEIMFTTTENRIEFIPVIQFKVQGFGFKIYNRLEYKNISQDIMYQWRPGLKIKKDISINSFSFTPYIYDDFFYNLTDGYSRQNRLYAGIEKKITTRLEMALFYMILSKNSSDSWNNINVFGTFFAFQIN